MVDSFVQNRMSLEEARKFYKRASKILNKAKKIRKITKAAKRPKKATRPAKKVAAKRPAVTKDWLSRPIKIRKITAPALSKVKSKLGFKTSTGRISTGALRSVSSRPVAGSWNGVDLIPVMSSNVASYGYDFENNTLITQFLDGSIYEYFSVPEDVWHRFQTAPSKGRFVWAELRNVFDYQRVR